MVVLLPAPLGPKKPTISPLPILNDTLSIALTEPYCFVKRLTITEFDISFSEGMLLFFMTPVRAGLCRQIATRIPPGHYACKNADEYPNRTGPTRCLFFAGDIGEPL